jgi:hypothetical protein
MGHVAYAKCSIPELIEFAAEMKDRFPDSTDGQVLSYCGEFYSSSGYLPYETLERICLAAYVGGLDAGFHTAQLYRIK